MSKSQKSLVSTIRSAVSAHNLPNYSKDSVKLGAQRGSKRRKKWTSAPSRGEKDYSPEEGAQVHLALKNYLTARRLKLSRLTGTDAVLEAETIAEFLDYLRAQERK